MVGPRLSKLFQLFHCHNLKEGRLAYRLNIVYVVCYFLLNFPIEFSITKMTFLIAHNNPINGFRPDATHPSRRHCSLRVSASWSHQSMTGIPRFGPCNRYKVVLSTDFRRSPHQMPNRGCRWIFIRCTTSMSLRSLYNLLLDRLRKSSPSRTGPKILHSTFLGLGTFLRI